MKYFEYRRYRLKLKLYKYMAIAVLALAAYGFIKLRQKGYTTDQLLKYIYITCAAVLTISAGIKIALVLIKKRKYLNSSLYKVDHMSGQDFEKYLKAHFETLGYRVKLTPDTNDYGADLICKNREETIVIQAKRYKGKVGIAAVQEICGAKGFYHADKCMVVTNSFFTPAAIELAKRNDVRLVDRNDINRMFVHEEAS